MQVQILGSLTHLLWCYIYIIYFKFSLIGCGFAQASTNLVILIGNIHMSRKQKEL